MPTDAELRQLQASAEQTHGRPATLEPIADAAERLRSHLEQCKRTRGPTPGPACQRCSDTGWELLATDVRQRCRECWSVDRSLVASGMTPSQLLETLDNQHPQNASKIGDLLELIDAHMMHPDFDCVRSLLFLGKPGTGKGSLAAALARYAVGATGWRLRFVEVSGLLARLKESYRTDGSGNASNILTPLYRVRLLVLNDWPIIRVSDWVREQMHELINERIERQLPTIGTANYLSVDAIAHESAYGDRIGSRLGPRFWTVVDFDGQDLRELRERVTR